MFMETSAKSGNNVELVSDRDPCPDPVAPVLTIICSVQQL